MATLALARRAYVQSRARATLLGPLPPPSYTAAVPTSTVYPTSFHMRVHTITIIPSLSSEVYNTFEYCRNCGKNKEQNNNISLLRCKACITELYCVRPGSYSLLQRDLITAPFPEQRMPEGGLAAPQSPLQRQ